MAVENKFLGIERMTVDGKGRVGIPSRFMSVLKAIDPERAGEVGLMLTPDGSIKIMPAPYFDKAVQDCEQLDDLDEDERILLNLTTGLAELVPLDTQNRIKINPTMREMCGIDRQVMFMGTLNYIQMFDVARWREKVAEDMKRYSVAAGKKARRNEPPQPVQYVINAGGPAGPSERNL